MQSVLSDWELIGWSERRQAVVHNDAGNAVSASRLKCAKLQIRHVCRFIRNVAARQSDASTTPHTNAMLQAFLSNGGTKIIFVQLFTLKF